GSVDPETGKIYGSNFPLISVGDNVRAQARLLDSLGIRKLRLVLGGSIGGMHALNHLQRQAIQHDPEWLGGSYLPQRPPRRGLALARQIAMISYKSAPLLEE